MTNHDQLYVAAVTAYDQDGAIDEQQQRALMRYFLDAGPGFGIIVNVSSDTVRAPEPRQGAYAASKAALSAFSESVAYEVADRGVHVHVLYPGWVPTAMGLSGNEDGGSLPPKLVRRTAEQVATLTADRMGGPKIDINAAWLPLVAPIARTVAPRSYQRAMRRMATTGGATAPEKASPETSP